MSTVKSKKLQVGTDATSSNNFTIYQPSTPDGTLRIGVGNADSPTEVGRFTSAGYKPATAPAFSAYLGTTQVISTLTFTKLQIDTEEFDTTNDYDNTTNYRFTPSVAGYYQITLTAFLQSVGDTKGSLCSIYKNGGEVQRGNQGANGAAFDRITTASTLVYLNGSTDYIEFYTYHDNGTDRNALGQRRLNAASAFLVQQA